ncbi:MAG: hypothetical protein HRU30_19760 [Rhodobacteraceae bacterium]|nr:hypothetical protein [Paracoccaceae bacterium]
MQSAMSAKGLWMLSAKPIRVCLAFCAGLALSACASDVRFTPEVEVSTQDAGIEQDALDAAARTFFGGDIPFEDEDDPFDGVGSISSRPLEKQRSSAVTARLRAKQSVSPHVSVLGEVALSEGSGAYFLPEGTEVLTDPAQISFSSTALDVTLGLSREKRHAWGHSSDLFGGVGYRASRTRARISSALLDVDDASTDADTYLFLGAQAKYPLGSRVQGYVGARGRKYSGGPYDARVSLGLSFE